MATSNAPWENDTVAGAAVAQSAQPNVDVRPLDTGGYGAYVDGNLIGGGATPDLARSSVSENSGEAMAGQNGQASDTAAPWESDPEPTTSLSDKVSTVGRGATGSMIETGGTLAGMGAGAAIGAVAPPPLWPITVPAGAIIGGIAGNMAGNEARDIASGVTLPGADAPMTYGNVDDLPPELRPYAFGGEVVGGGLPFAAAPLAAARAGARLAPSFIGNGINKIIETAARAPQAFTMAELSALGSAGVASGVAETYYPGNDAVRIGAEITAGLLSPVSIATSLSSTGASTLRRAVGAFSPGARETRAGQIIQEIVRDFGEDPEQLAVALRQSGLPGMNMTAGQKTGSPALIAMEKKLSESSAKFGADAQARAEDGLKSIGDMITALARTGDPEALRAAAQLRQRYFNGILTARVQDAQRVALEAAEKITKDTPAARAELGRIARDAVEKALSEARTVERELWGRIPVDREANAGNVISAFDDVRAGLLEEEKLPAIVEGFVSRMREGQGRTDVSELLRFRSRMLALSREADAKQEFNDSRIYGQMAEAALDDLAGIGDDVAQTVTDARVFSRQLNETFRRTFAGAASASTRNGADRIPPELLVRRVFAGGAEATAMRMDELERASRFIPDMNMASPDAQLAVDEMIDAQERMLRIAAADSIDPQTGQVNAKRLSKFIRDNGAVLDRFPQAKADMLEAVKSNEGMKAMERAATGASKAIEQKAAFSKLANLENPVDALGRAISSGNAPLRTLEGFAKIAKRGGTDGVEGLKATILDYAVRRSTARSGAIDIGAIRRVLESPIRPGQPSLMDIMTKAGIFKVDEVERLNTLFDQAERIIDALSGVGALDDLSNGPDMLIDMVSSIVGARFGAMASQSNASLVAAGRGASTARKIFDKVPRGKVNDLLIEAAKDPRLMAELMERSGSPQEKIELARRMHSYLWQIGLTEPSDDE
ncbi:hypothetical protein [Thalassospira povalilytica]|uniref:hypothetical protein n=1 Tax=Thalassospira povalilytica TaxID=732237 RepID=UPI001D1801BB|nr:hypothetical protein [Thalassospira povalilytica]MCC4240388.1 hypothetical protein [Thalassospira povalilytica]